MFFEYVFIKLVLFVVVFVYVNSLKFDLILIVFNNYYSLNNFV